MADNTLHKLFPKRTIHCYSVSGCVVCGYIVVFVVHDLVLGPDDEVCGKSLYTMPMKALSTWVYPFRHTRLLYEGLQNTVMLKL